MQQDRTKKCLFSLLVNKISLSQLSLNTQVRISTFISNTCKFIPTNNRFAGSCFVQWGINMHLILLEHFFRIKMCINFRNIPQSLLQAFNICSLLKYQIGIISMVSFVSLGIASDTNTPRV